MTCRIGPVTVLMVGPAGSGKSTYVRKKFPGFVVLNGDSIRHELTGDESNQERNPEVFELLRKRLGDTLMVGESVVIDNTNLQRTHRQNLYQIARKSFSRIEAHVMPTGRDECLRRNRMRWRSVPDEVIVSQFEDFLVSLSELPREPELDAVVIVGEGA